MAASRSRSVVPVAVAALLLSAVALAFLLRGGSGPPEGVAMSPPSPDGAAPVAAATGAQAPPAAPRAAPEASDPDVPHTRLPLRLLATVVRENAALSLATVEDLDRTAHQVLTEGESFRGHPQAGVVRIERGRILLDHDGVREQLVIDRTDRAPLDVAYAISPEEAERRREMGRRLRELTDAGTNYREVLEEGERGGLLEEGDVSPVYAEDGEMVGVQFDAIRAGGLYDQIGLRDGDVVTNINGIPLADPTAAAEVMAEFALSEEITVDVERPDGSLETLSLPTADVFERLQRE